MAKIRSLYSCSACNHQSPKWVGCCSGCGAWNTLVEQIISPTITRSGGATLQLPPATMLRLDEISDDRKERFITGIDEWDRVMGGGILADSFIILTGDPGIGKSTLLLQVADALTNSCRVLYFSSEESLQQVKYRAQRLGIDSSSLQFSDQSCLEQIVATAQTEQPDIIIIDSIQNCQLSSQPQALPGMVTQLREAALILMRLAKEDHIAVLITGHITKDGNMAGPKLLEHMVDGVFYLQGEDRWQTRILRSVKNRFGTINEVGFFEMEERGLRPVSDINHQLLQQTLHAPGSTLICTLEGSRPILVELQALCVDSKFGIPQRVVTGVDAKWVVLIAAILEKHLHIPFSGQDIFFKVSSGFKVRESSADLGIALSLLSSYFQHPLPPRSLTLGDVNLTGHIMQSHQTSIRIKEAEKFGIKNVLTARQVNGTADNCVIHEFRNVYDLLRLFPQQ